MHFVIVASLIFALFGGLVGFGFARLVIRTVWERTDSLSFRIAIAIFAFWPILFHFFDHSTYLYNKILNGDAQRTSLLTTYVPAGVLLLGLAMSATVWLLKRLPLLSFLINSLALYIYFYLVYKLVFEIITDDQSVMLGNIPNVWMFIESAGSAAFLLGYGAGFRRRRVRGRLHPV